MRVNGTDQDLIFGETAQGSNFVFDIVGIFIGNTAIVDLQDQQVFTVMRNHSRPEEKPVKGAFGNPVVEITYDGNRVRGGDIQFHEPRKGNGFDSHIIKRLSVFNPVISSPAVQQFAYRQG